MKKQNKVIVTNKHLKQSIIAANNSSKSEHIVCRCPVAMALKDTYKTNNIEVGYTEMSVNNVRYRCEEAAIITRISYTDTLLNHPEQIRKHLPLELTLIPV